jgi:seryl-tRNA synthetase
MTHDELTAIRERLASDPQRCPFDYPDCKVRPDDPCPVCGDVDDLDVPVKEHEPSRCVANNTRLLRDDLAALLQHVEALESDYQKLVSAVAHDLKGLTAERDILKTKVEALTQERNQLLGELCFVHGRDIPETEAAARAVLVKRAHDAEAERDRLQGELAEARKAREQAERCARADDNSEHRGRSAKFYGDDNGFGGHR